MRYVCICFSTVVLSALAVVAFSALGNAGVILIGIGGGVISAGGKESRMNAAKKIANIFS